MFTGLIQGQGQVISRRRQAFDLELTVKPSFEWTEPLNVGESIAVSGVCLTVNELKGALAFSAFVSAESLKATTLGQIDSVNLERALRLCDRLGGHLVSGHVDAVVELLVQTAVGNSRICWFSYPSHLSQYIVSKGSVALDGVSLTVNQTLPDRFSVNLIPQTIQATTLSSLKTGALVNLETDLLSRYLQGLLKGNTIKTSEGLTIEQLVKEGF
ncbi:MAG: riboflavin synthase [Deltaproteobacteria bacterium]|jgi:riboflavin synthase|nr:riboflavin synthase [Deltaproteobacteria bacterium]